MLEIMGRSPAVAIHGACTLPCRCVGCPHNDAVTDRSVIRRKLIFHLKCLLLSAPTRTFRFADRVKTLLAQGNVVIHIDNKYIEWYYPALLDGVHYISTQLQAIETLCNAVARLQQTPAAAVNMSLNAQAFSAHVLTIEVRNMYVAEIVMQWGEIFSALQNASNQS
jgi:hypothetical protein